MRTRSSGWILLAVSAVSFAAAARASSAAEPFNLIDWMQQSVMQVQSGTCGGGACDHASCCAAASVCDQCGHAECECGPCIERVPVKKCVPGKKKVYDCTVCYQYVSIPETKYRWRHVCITKEIPCPYCKPVCETEEVEHVYHTEKWEKEPLCGCTELHCRTCEPKTEKVPCKHCNHKEGKTTIKVHYWTCVKEPYTVYRQVKKPVCVKRPHYEHVSVPITKHVCHHHGKCADGDHCDQCGG